MKFTKLLPIALAFTLCTSAAVMADDLIVPEETAGKAGDVSLEYQLTLPDFYDIEASSTKQASDVFYGSNYSVLQIKDEMNAKFNVISNKGAQDGSDYAYLSAKCLSNSEQVEALYGDANASAVYIVFTNEGGSPNITEADADNLTADADTSNDAVVFLLKQGAVTPSEGGSVGTKAFTTHNIKYPIKNGKYEFNYSIGGQAVANTFSARDSKGTYKATLYMNRTAL